MIRGIPRESCYEQKLTEYFQEAYPTFHITHLTLVYNIAVLQHVYKRRFDSFFFSFCLIVFCLLFQRTQSSNLAGKQTNVRKNRQTTCSLQ